MVGSGWKGHIMNTESKPRNFKDLLVWQRGIQLVKGVYLLTRGFPSEEKFGLISQMRRAAVSIPSNIAEGQARNTTGEFIQFLAIAQGSLAELETQLIVATELGFCSPEAIRAISENILQLKKMLYALRAKLSHCPPPSTHHPLNK
jgi:four helix bundle protein